MALNVLAYLLVEALPSENVAAQEKVQDLTFI
jgi:hypothetical protein